MTIADSFADDSEPTELQSHVDCFTHNLLSSAEECVRLSLDPATDELLAAEEAKIIIAKSLIDGLARKYQDRRHDRPSV